ncbi:MAG: hypothetical protein ACI8S6_000291, partial [Myxococcota bacterium]
MSIRRIRCPLADRAWAPSDEAGVHDTGPYPDYAGSMSLLLCQHDAYLRQGTAHV